jgi:hypothetical protein
MRFKNIFDDFTHNEDVSEIALCAMYNLLKKLIAQYEMSSYYRIKSSFEDLYETRSELQGNNRSDENPF